MTTSAPIKPDRQRSLHLMQAVDDATKKALADLGLEAFRFDIDVCPDEQWMRVKIKIRPLTQDRGISIVQSRQARG